MRAPLIALPIGAALLVASCAGSTVAETVPATVARATSPSPSTTVMVSTTVAAVESTATPPTTSHEAPEILSVVGVVIAVEGGLSGIDSFTIRIHDGSDVSFLPDDEARFDGGPFSHVRDHFTSGSPIRVDYVVLDDGSTLALGAEDA